ncbi:hypothetical protein K1718_16650 [Roseibium porphyridii]|uniref:Uncharacterized protein n=1 Tax=Roseibium porphyridii TaxID=2866279 RepID=A0ABY8EY90_9HYPH|nr:hypothetical protein [Roseibium sp. KMA01]WFE87786.1 hypothetical protein K1718_16650 [Roseibium sp. KMA01]
MGSRIRFTKAKQVFETYPELSDNVVEPTSDVAPQDYVRALQEGESPLTSICYFAHALPKRESVWWGMKCVSGLGAVKTDTDRHILELCEHWVREGDEEARSAVQAAAEAAKPDSAAVWIGMAAGWSGGSLSPNPDHRVDMPADLTAKAVNAGIMIAMGHVEPPNRDNALDTCISAGLSFAEGGSMPTVSLREPAAL